MPTLEKRVQALEQGHAELRKMIELHTIALSAMVDKTTLEKLTEKYDKLFDALINHDRLTNEQLAELRKYYLVLDGKIVGLQAEMRQRFLEQDDKITALDGKIVGLQTEMRQRLAEQDGKIAVLDGKVTDLDGKVAVLDGKVTDLDGKVAVLDGKVTKLQETQAEHTVLLQQILARLPEKPVS